MADKTRAALVSFPASTGTSRIEIVRPSALSVAWKMIVICAALWIGLLLLIRHIASLIPL